MGNISHLAFFSAIWFIWLLITTTAIPVALSHGVLYYQSYKEENNTACVFLSQEGYNLVAFQVRQMFYF